MALMTLAAPRAENRCHGNSVSVHFSGHERKSVSVHFSFAWQKARNRCQFIFPLPGKNELTPIFPISHFAPGSLASSMFLLRSPAAAGFTFLWESPSRFPFSGLVKSGLLDGIGDRFGDHALQRSEPNRVCAFF
jgi:hypothetical protein